MFFDDTLKIKVNNKKRVVTLSIRTTENKVEVFKISLSDFEKMIASYNSQKE